MNESPETDDDLGIRRLLAESGTGDSPELLEGLRLLRSFRELPVPAPTGELAALLTPAPPQPRRRSQRHRGLILSFALAGAMGAGTTGVAANNDLRLATESFCDDVIEQVMPGEEGAGEQPLSAEAPSAEAPPAEGPSAAEETPPMVGDAAAEPDAEFAAEPEDPGVYPPSPASPSGDVPGEGEATADVEGPARLEAPLPAPHVEPESVLPDNSARDRGRNAGHTVTARPGQDSAGEGPGRPGHRQAGAGHSGHGPGAGTSRDRGDAAPHVPAAGTPFREARVGGKQP